MRFFLIPALALLTIGFMNAGTANAWTCQGAEHVCGSSSVSKKTVSGKKVAYHKSAKHKRVATAYKAKKKSYSSASYGGGSSGMASYYWQGQMTASGARFNPGALTAAHRSLPFGTRVLVTNKVNGRSVTVTINDRGPLHQGPHHRPLVGSSRRDRDEGHGCCARQHLGARQGLSSKASRPIKWRVPPRRHPPFGVYGPINQPSRFVSDFGKMRYLAESRYLWLARFREEQTRKQEQYSVAASATALTSSPDFARAETSP